MKALGQWTVAEIEDEIATLATRIAAATGRLLELLGELDSRESLGDGFLSLAHWLSWRTGLRLPAAREHVRVARAFRALPKTAAALCGGEISYSKARAITRVAQPHTEEQLLEMAKAGSAAQLERIVRGVRTVGLAESERAQRIEDRRYLHHSFDEDGMLVVRARLAPEEGALLLRAWEAAREGMVDDGAAALARVADRSLCGDDRNGSDRNQVVIHVDDCVLRDPQSEGRSQLADGPSVSAGTSRRLACDASVVVMRHGAGGETIDVGRKMRLVPNALRRAVVDRDDGHCVFPGCSNRYVDVHHAKHWADGGTTTLDNVALLCRRHHVIVHDHGYRVEIAPDQVRVFKTDGNPFRSAPPPPPWQPLGPFTGEDPWALAPSSSQLDYVDYDWAVQSALP